jgi:malate synthase
LKFDARIADSRPVKPALYAELLASELTAIRAEYGDARYDRGHFPAATALFMELVHRADFPEFLSLPAYELLP